jgi:hypothetical protein
MPFCVFVVKCIFFNRGIVVVEMFIKLKGAFPKSRKFGFLALKGRQHTSPGQRPGEMQQVETGRIQQKGKYISFSFLNLDYAEKDE